MAAPCGCEGRCGHSDASPRGDRKQAGRGQKDQPEAGLGTAGMASWGGGNGAGFQEKGTRGVERGPGGPPSSPLAAPPTARAQAGRRLLEPRRKQAETPETLG